jgi:hypothetical protein
VVPQSHLTPAAIPKLGRALRRVDDVGEEDRGEDPIERRLLLADLGQETTKLADDRVTSRIPVEVGPPRLECSTTRAPGILLATKWPVSGSTS